MEDLSELSRLRKDVQRIMVALEKLAGIEGQDSDEELLSWLESEGEEIEVQGRKEKGKQKEERIDGVEEKEEVGGQEEENGMEGMKEGSNSFSLVMYSVGTSDGDQREFDLETRVITNENIIIPKMFHSCALNK